MRIYARYTDKNGNKLWDVVETGPDGSNAMVYLVQLIQVCLLYLGESPFYAQYGIPARQSVAQQQAPDFYIARIQQQFAPFFASLIITRTQGPPDNPTYAANVTLKNGQHYTLTIPANELSQRPGF